jgi:hypothetical protein
MRYESPEIVMTTERCNRRSSIAPATEVPSPKALAHWPTASLVVRQTERRKYLREMTWKRAADASWASGRGSVEAGLWARCGRVP